MTRPVARRCVVASAALLALPGALRAAPASLPTRPMLFVAGPEGSRVCRWADTLAPALGQTLGGTDAVVREHAGGADGVTGVNLFAARINPDGGTALVLPGTALLAWLAGDARVRFDVGAWAPLWGGSARGTVVTRAPLVRGRSVRIAVDGIVGAELAALLALHLMGADAVIVPRMAGDPLAQADVDVAYYRGRPAPERLEAGGWRPAFAVVPPGPAHGPADTAGPRIPLAHELFDPARAAVPGMLEAYRAVSAAAALDVALVVPAVAPSAVVAWWRRGCEQLDDAPAVRVAAAADGLRSDDVGGIAAQFASVAIDAPAKLALRSWLADRYDWRPI